MSRRIRTGAVCSAACGTGSLCKGGDGSAVGEGAQVRIRPHWNFLTAAETTAGEDPGLEAGPGATSAGP